MGFLGLMGFGGGATGASLAGGAGVTSGGVMLTPGDGYTYHVFAHPNPNDATGQFIAGSTLTCDYLLVGGGGTGGCSGPNKSGAGGGGGGGGVRQTTGATFPAGTYTVTVGAGGNPAPAVGRNPNGMPQFAGGYSQIGPQPSYGRAVGGGFGGQTSVAQGGSGGSGGGGQDGPGGGGEGQRDTTCHSPPCGSAASPTALYGYDGNDGSNGSGTNVRGGGGAGGSGGNGQGGSPNGGPGGEAGAASPYPIWSEPKIGPAPTIPGTYGPIIGPNGYYGCGGRGGSGGQGTLNGKDGIGAGGKGAGLGNNPGETGHAGIVMVRYPVS